MSAYTFTNLPPIPDKVVTSDRKILFTSQEIIQGKYLFQKYGLMDYGSVLGFGGYFGIDFTSYTLALDENYIASYYGFKNVSTTNTSEMTIIKNALNVNYNKVTNTVTMSIPFGIAFEKSIAYYSNYLGNESAQIRLKPNLITNTTEIMEITSFFTWSVIISLMGYTNGFPYTPGLINYSTNVVFSSWLMLGVLMVVIMPIVAYVFLKLLSYWNDPKTPIDLPKPNNVQRLTIYGILITSLAAGVQGLLGAYTMHLYTSPNFYGVDLLNFLPFNVSRALHYTLAVLWIAVTWIAFSLFVLPYFGLKLTKKQVLIILGLGVIVSAFTLLGILLNYLQIIPYQSSGIMWWFLFGGQGRDVATQGTFWLILIAILLFYVSYLFYVSSKTAPQPLQPLAKILSIAIGGTAFGTIIGALPVIQPWPNFTMDEYFRWIFVHAFVEGFWPAIVVTILITLLIIAGLFPVRLGIAIAGLDGVLEVVTGMIGTAHHYYWGGQPVLWMYVGSVVSTLEAIPLGLAIVYAILLWKKGEIKTEFQKTIATFTIVAGIGGGIGAAVFGAGLINLPYLNYYLHDLQTTMAHAHLAFPLAFGLPTMLMWVVMMYLTGGFNDKHLKWMRYSSIIIGIGFYLQVLISLMPLGIFQFIYELKYGFWYTKSLFTPTGISGFWQIPIIQNIIDLRMIGDLVAAAGMGIIIFGILFNFRKSLLRIE